MNVKRIFRGPILWIVLAVIAIGLLIDLTGNLTGGYTEEPTSKVVQIINGDEPLKEVILKDGEQEIQVTTAGDKPAKYKAVWVGNQSQDLVKRLNERVAAGTLESWQGLNPTPGFFQTLLGTLIPFIIIGVLFFFLLNSVQGGGSRVMQFGKSKAKVANKDTPKTTFADVAGCEEAIEELEEIKEFLAEPAKFQAVGAKIPKGVLLYGPPGTGKTLLARAVAGEAGVPFYSISGSDFVEMFVGVGASRVRDLFEQAKENAPAIVFIDEIDAVGRHRGAGMGGGHDEREQTLNQLLVEMDGFDVRGGVILIAATNRPDVLDPALLRPGRFDRQIAVEAPDLKGRFQILKVHAEGKPMGPDIDLEGVARRTPGFTGADLANVLNEAALLTARKNERMITNADLDEAIDRVIAGPQKRSRLMNEHEKLITAYHEGGHALVAAALPGTDPVQKVTILPRGRALGYTMVLPEQDKYANTRAELLDQLAYMMGGRAAEELVFHDPTTGASNDIEKATNVARAMVTQYGMTERLGAIKLGSSGSEPFLGRDFGHQKDYSEDIAAVVDQEVSKLISNAHQEAFDILTENRDVLDDLVRALFEKETLDRAEVAAVFQPLRLRPKRPAWTGSDTRVPSSIPPVMPPPPAIPVNGQNGHHTNGHAQIGAGAPAGGGQAGQSGQGGTGHGGSGQSGYGPVGGPSVPPNQPGPQQPGPTQGGPAQGGPAQGEPGQSWPPAGPDFR
ncbi:cell division protein FtsH [Microlunatus phosphovorus NM-1]|uniref:ATP-dependent zinc metalloprotease FtsH n=1 Tax=Microlunatus phosphovorus (strain ATCC 700054 / DSM 10555 / JCM 9379 / NBRC 101784 / NCIMB 13414 / VKM Ac-1990 / NM-1) TaxID=1032480 RepID=F5XFC3_MICPN|nr:cell division protein FtsH [Microlunatus phosphovorus NM-1]